MTAALPDEAAIAALAALPDVGPARLRALLALDAPFEVLASLAAGRLRPTPALCAATGRSAVDDLLGRWSRAARELDPVDLWERHVAAGISVVRRGADGFPAAFADDPDPPEVVFLRGRAALLEDTRRVAVVGTRRCTRYGFDLARAFGSSLAAAGVVVVSGLAAGIDGAAHRGVLDSGLGTPVGVVGTGLDVVYPAAHRGLWEEVAQHGVLVSESPLGTRPSRWRFPARNRLIAALAEVVVVVESGATGGALHTVDEALRRDRPVLAVPGPVTSAASVGTNALLRDVAAPCCDVDDVLVALGLAPRSTGAPAPEHSLDATARAVLDAVGPTPATLEAVVARTGLGLGRAALELESLVAAGLLVTDGPWFERKAPETWR